MPAWPIWLANGQPRVGQCRRRPKPQIRFIARLQAGEQDIAREQQD